VWLKCLINSIHKLLFSKKLAHMIKCNPKCCNSCGSRRTKKDWKRKRRQSYKCNDCNHVRVSKSRKKKVFVDKLYKEYAIHKQTYQELGMRYNLSKKTVQRKLDSFALKPEKRKQWWDIVLLIDTTYMWWEWIMLFKDAYSKRLLHYEIVAYETNDWYRKWILRLQNEWWNIKAIVSDGRRWLLWWFGDIPTQMCQFHQKMIVRRYITKNPILVPNQELNSIVKRLCRTDKTCFEQELTRRYNSHEGFLKEKAVSTTTWKSYFVHRRTRAAYRSLKSNMKYLFVYEDYRWKIEIPNTTNAIEAEFSHFKYKVNLHRWLRRDRKLKLIDYILKSRY